MNEKKKQEIPMPFKFDDFFTTQEQRDDAVKEKIEEIDISLIDNFKDHPFKVLDNDDMKSLKESIKTIRIIDIGISFFFTRITLSNLHYIKYEIRCKSAIIYIIP